MTSATTNSRSGILPPGSIASKANVSRMQHSHLSYNPTCSPRQQQPVPKQPIRPKRNDLAPSLARPTARPRRIIEATPLLRQPCHDQVQPPPDRPTDHFPPPSVMARDPLRDISTTLVPRFDSQTHRYSSLAPSNLVGHPWRRDRQCSRKAKGYATFFFVSYPQPLLPIWNPRGTESPGL